MPVAEVGFTKHCSESERPSKGTVGFLHKGCLGLGGVILGGSKESRVCSVCIGCCQKAEQFYDGVSQCYPEEQNRGRIRLQLVEKIGHSY